MNFWIIQLIGAIGYSIFSFSFFKKRKKDILFYQIVSYVFFVIHYYLLSGITGSICSLIEIFGLLLIFFLDKYFPKKKNIGIIFIATVVVALASLTYENIFSLFPIIGTCTIIFSFMQNDENVIRITGVISTLCWIAYAVYYKSYAALVFESITLVAITYSYIKIIINKKRNK